MKLKETPIPHPPNPFGFSIEACDAIITAHYPSARDMVHGWRQVRSNTEPMTRITDAEDRIATNDAAELLLDQRIVAYEFARLEQPSVLPTQRSRRSRKQLEAGLRGHRLRAEGGTVASLRAAIKADPRFHGEPAIHHMVPGYTGKLHTADITRIMVYASNGSIIQV